MWKIGDRLTTHYDVILIITSKDRSPIEERHSLFWDADKILSDFKALVKGAVLDI